MEYLQLVYRSAATTPFNEEQLSRLLERARLNNQANDITGVLLYDSGSFLQVLEGDEQAVTRVYNRIAEDERHGNTTMVLRRMVSSRSFPDWAMGFVPDAREIMEAVPGFRDMMTRPGNFQSIISEDNVVVQVLEGFRTGTWRSAA